MAKYIKDSKKPVFLFFKNYITVIKNSIGSNIFRNLSFKIKGKNVDVLENGNLSCAFFVSSILYLFDLIEELHTTVSWTVRDMKGQGWKKIKKLIPGSILIWEEVIFKDGNNHKHMGFYVGKGRAISNRYEFKTPRIHHWTFGTKNGKPKRKVEAIYWHKKLTN